MDLPNKCLDSVMQKEKNMYKALKEGKIIAISDTDSEFKFLVKDGVVEDIEHTCEDYEQYNGEYLLKSEIPAPTEEEQRQKRAEAYRLEKDPITCQITSLRDEEQTPEIIEEINNLLQKRTEVVKDIQERYPYPVDNDQEYDVLMDG